MQWSVITFTIFIFEHEVLKTTQTPQNLYLVCKPYPVYIPFAWLFPFFPIIIFRHNSPIFRIPVRWLTGKIKMNNLKKRNFLIEPFKHMVVADARYPENTWKILEHAIQEIFNHNSCSLSFEELYRFAFYFLF